MYEDLLAQGLDATQARLQVSARFGSPELVAAGFHALPPPRWVRGMRVGAGPMGAAVLGLVMGLALLQVSAPHRAPAGLVAEVELSEDTEIARRHVREVDALQTPLDGSPPGAYQVASRLGVARAVAPVLEPSVRAYVPSWLPDGYHPDRGGLFLTASATIQYFADAKADRSGIVVETLRPDRSTVFQVKERHVFFVEVGGMPGFYIDGEWEVRGPVDEQPAPATWRTDRSHSLLFVRDGLLILVAGPPDVVDADGLVRIARSLR